MYADDTAIFVNPIKEDIGALTELLNKFGEVSGLKTNFKKSSVVPIRCEGIDLDYVLGGLPIIKTNFPLVDCWTVELPSIIILASPKSPTWATISASKSSLLGLRSQCIIGVGPSQ
jgi:hypothetical protein